MAPDLLEQADSLSLMAESMSKGHQTLIAHFFIPAHASLCLHAVGHGCIRSPYTVSILQILLQVK